MKKQVQITMLFHKEVCHISATLRQLLIFFDGHTDHLQAKIQEYVLLRPVCLIDFLLADYDYGCKMDFNNIAMQMQLCNEERWILKAIKKIREQRNSLRVSYNVSLVLPLLYLITAYNFINIADAP